MFRTIMKLFSRNAAPAAKVTLAEVLQEHWFNLCYRPAPVRRANRLNEPR